LNLPKQRIWLFIDINEVINNLNTNNGKYIIVDTNYFLSLYR